MENKVDCRLRLQVLGRLLQALVNGLHGCLGVLFSCILSSQVLCLVGWDIIFPGGGDGGGVGDEGGGLLGRGDVALQP